MPLGRKKAGAPYQRLMNGMFKDLIGKSMEVYVDDMLVKSKTAGDHIEHMNKMFNNIRKYQMKLNPLKCAFGVGLGRFLGFMVNQGGIEENLEKINALLEMSSPRKPKEVMSLADRVTALSHFVSRATDRCTPFFNMLKKKFEWTEKCKQAFLALKEHLGHPLLLSKLIDREKLFLYFVVSDEAVSAALVREEEKIQWPVCYMSKRLLDVETRYPGLEKLALALMVASRKLRSYFHAHLIMVLTN